MSSAHLGFWLTSIVVAPQADVSTVTDKPSPTRLESAKLTEITCIAIAPKGARVAIGARDGSTRVVDLDNLRTTRLQGCGSGAVLRLGWSPDGQTLAAGAFDVHDLHADAISEWIDAPADWRAWDVASGRPFLAERTANPGHEDPGIAWRGDGHAFVTWGCGRRADVFDVPCGERVGSLEIVDAIVTCAVWTSDPARIVIGDTKGVLHVWNTTTGVVERSLKSGCDAVRCLAYSPELHRVIAGGEGALVASWDTQSWARVWLRADSNGDLLDSDAVVSASLDARLDRLVTATNPWGVLQTRSLSTGALLWDHNFDGGNPARLFSAIDPGGEFLVSFGLDCCGAAKVWRSESGKVAMDLRDARGGPGSAGWTADGRYLVVREKDIHVFDGHTGSDLFRLRLNADAVEKVR